MMSLRSIDLQAQKIETLAIPVCEDQDIHADPAVAAIIQRAMQLPEFKGAKDDEVTLYDPPEVKARRVMIMGLGQRAKIDPETLRVMAGKTVKGCIQKDLAEVALAVPAAAKINLEEATVLASLL
ncbi:MAG: hypothetical protein JSW39_10625, partial [Desulfobacterales bacterium]